MRTLLVEPFAGIAGDMTVGALLDVGVPLEVVRDGLARLPVGGWEIAAEKTIRGVFAGTRFLVRAAEEDTHRHLSDVRGILAAADLPERARARAIAAFERLAAAEARAHGVTPEEIHFHEVGAIDAIVDIAGAALALEHLGVERVFTTAVRLGTGEVECRHGRIPVPAPGTVALLEGFPVVYAEGEGETTTPTGAAILAAWAEPAPPEFAFTPEWTGYGAGTRDDTPRPNLLRVTVGRIGAGETTDAVVELAANVDDQSPEMLAYAAERVLAAGALDVWISPVVMKKGRPGTVVTALAAPAEADAIEAALFRETSTFGVRRSVRTRAKLEREHLGVETPWGRVRVKVGRRDGEVLTRSPEYEDCARLARERDVPLRDVYAAALAALGA